MNAGNASKFMITDRVRRIGGLICFTGFALTIVGIILALIFDTGAVMYTGMGLVAIGCTIEFLHSENV